MIKETLYSFIQRTLVPQEYERNKNKQAFEIRLLTGEEKLRPMEMSYVVNPQDPGQRIAHIMRGIK